MVYKTNEISQSQVNNLEKAFIQTGISNHAHINVSYVKVIMEREWTRCTVNTEAVP